MEMERTMTERQLKDMLRKAETAEQVAEVCRLETVMKGGPWFNSNGQKSGAPK